MIDVANIFTLQKDISNPGMNIMWQFKPKMDCLVKHIEITPESMAAETVTVQLLDMSAAATGTAGAGDTTIKRHDPSVTVADFLDLSTTTTAHTCNAGTPGTNVKWWQSFDVRIGGLYHSDDRDTKGNAIKLLQNTLWGLKFKASPPTSRVWTVTIELAIGG